jgi:TonB family protein
LAAAKNHDDPKMESLIKQMEIPNYEDWFIRTYGEERGEGFADTYRRNLANGESDLEEVFQKLATEDGDFAFRMPSDDRTGEQASGVNTPTNRRQLDPADSFPVLWKNTGAKSAFRVGTFVYLDGSFRLLRAFRIMAIRPMGDSGPAAPRGAWSATNPSAPGDPSANGPVSGPIQPEVHIDVRPTCDSCPAAEYSEAARRKGLEGTVVLQAIVQPDGSPTDILVVKSPDPELTQMAMDTVSKWRFKPARNTDGQPVAYREAIEVSFRLAK